MTLPTNELAPVEPESLSRVTGGMQGGGAMRLLGMLGGLRGAAGQGQEQAQSAPAESQAAAPSGGGLPIDQIMAFAQNPNMQSGLALVGTLLSRRSQAQGQ